MITELENRDRTGRLEKWGYSFKELLFGGGVFLFVGFVSFSGVIAMKKHASLSHSDVLAGVPVPGSINADDYTIDGVPVALEPIPPELTYQGPPKDLQQPYLSKAPGSFLDSEFPIRLSISNPNDTSTWVMYSINGRQFMRYSGGPINIKAGDNVEAYVRGDTREWNESPTVSGTYASKSSGALRPGQVPVRRIKFRN